MVAEMHSSYQALRRECPMNVRGRVALTAISDETRADVVRILTLWAEARARFGQGGPRSEEHTSELQSLMRISYAVFCLKKKKKKNNNHIKAVTLDTNDQNLNARLLAV